MTGQPLPAVEAMASVADLVHYWAQHTPDAEALILEDRRLTYRRFDDAVNRCAAALLDLGIQPGDRVALLGLPRPEYFTLFLATARIGGIWLGLNPKYHLDELRYVVGDAQPKILFAMTHDKSRDYAGEMRTLESENAFIERLILFGNVKPVQDDFEQFLAEHDRVSCQEVDEAADRVQPMDVTLLVYTSGSTGRPKGAMLTHRGLVRCSLTQVRQFHCSPLRILCNLPINHIGCTGDICCYALAAGGAIIFMESYDPEGSLRAIQNERITVWGQVPTQFQLSCSLPNFGDYDLSSLQVIAWGGAAAPRELIQFLSTFGAQLSTNYGMTETTGAVTFTQPGDSLNVLADTVGRPVPHYEVRIARPDGSPCATGEQGEIQVRGDFVMKGYFNRPKASAETIDKDGWLHTGDVAVERDDGNYRIVGRLSQMYKSGGYNVYPREIELAIEEHPAVAMAAVVAVPDPLYQEVGFAYVMPMPGVEIEEETLRTYCKNCLANYKVPKRFLIQSMLPMLPVGKVDKMALKETALKTIESNPT